MSIRSRLFAAVLIAAVVLPSLTSAQTVLQRPAQGERGPHVRGAYRDP